jgi:hypothetical protein
MYETLEESTHTCPVSRFSGKVTSDEYTISNCSRRAIKTSEKSTCGAVEEQFEFYGDLSAAGKDSSLLLMSINMSAGQLVGDQMWIDWFTRLISPLPRGRKCISGWRARGCFEWASE